MNTEQLLESSLVPMEDAAEALGIEPKRLLGLMARNGITDPIGGDTPEGIMVYGWSCKGLAERLVRDRESEVVNESSHNRGEA